jgi:hypothetical protein
MAKKLIKSEVKYPVLLEKYRGFVITRHLPMGIVTFDTAKFESYQQYFDIGFSDLFEPTK